MIAIEPAPGSTIAWYATFTPGGRTYHYAAVHVGGKGWYTTDTSNNGPLDFATLQLRIAGSPAYVMGVAAQIPHQPAHPGAAR